MLSRTWKSVRSFGVLYLILGLVHSVKHPQSRNKPMKPKTFGGLRGYRLPRNLLPVQLPAGPSPMTPP